MLILLLFGIAGIGMALNAPHITDPFFAVIYAVVSFPIIIMNFRIFYYVKKMGKFVSAIPLFGGLYGAIAMALLGKSVRWLFWIPLILDWGCVVIVFTIVKIILCALGKEKESSGTVPTSRQKTSKNES